MEDSPRSPLLLEGGSINAPPPPARGSCGALFKSLGAYLTLCIMMACWIIEGEFSQSLEDGCPDNNTTHFPGKTDLCYKSSFFIAYCTRVGWALVLVGWYIWRVCILDDGGDASLRLGSRSSPGLHRGRGLGAFSWGTYLRWGLLLGVAIFGSTYTWYLSLPLTSVAGNSAVYQSAPVFVFLFSIPALGESVTALKVAAVLLCVGGSAVVALENSSGGGGDSLTGYAWCICSVLLYAGFEVLYKKYACDDNDPYPVANSQRFFGLLGVAAVATMWPIFFVLDATGFEPFVWPERDDLPYIAIVAVCDVGFNLFLLITILLSSPLFASVGTILVIPLGAATDYLWKGTLLADNAFYGVGMIIVGFCAMIYAEHTGHVANHTAKAAHSVRSVEMSVAGSAGGAGRGQTRAVGLDAAMPAKSVAAIMSAFNSPPAGMFVRGRHGVTHYTVDTPATTATGSAPRKLAVCAHGIGTNVGVYTALTARLVDAGYTVLRYDFFGHGWSVPDDPLLRINDAVMLAQVEDVLDHICDGPNEPVATFVGHSTGGSVAILAAARLDRPIQSLSLVSPAIWAKKPLIARIADTIPNFFHGMLRLGLLNKAIEDAYIGGAKTAAFAMDSVSGEFKFPEAGNKKVADDTRMFASHPYG